MNMLPLILGCGALLGLAVLLLVAFHNWSYKAGLKEGYDKGYEFGRREVDNWWIRAESEVDQARVKIWREEAQL